jgi:hypothetical protein
VLGCTLSLTTLLGVGRPWKPRNIGPELFSMLTQCTQSHRKAQTCSRLLTDHMAKHLMHLHGLDLLLELGSYDKYISFVLSTLASW